MRSVFCVLASVFLTGCAHRTNVTAPSPPSPQDSITLVSAVAGPHHAQTELERGKLQRFDVTIRYTLVTRQRAKLSLSLTQFRNPDSCVVSPAEHVDSDEIDIQRGTNTVTLPITWPGDTGFRTKGRIFGYGSVSFAAALWGGHLQDRFYTTEFGRNFCLRFGPEPIADSTPIN